MTTERAAPAQAAAAVDLRQYLEVPLRRPRLILIPFVLVVAAAIGAAFTLPKKYMSSTQILVESQKVPDRLVQQNVGTERNRRLQTLNQEILSRTRLEKVVEELHPYARRPEVPLTVVVDSMRAAITVKVKGNDAFSVQFVHRDPATAQAVANRLVTLFIEESSQARERSVAETARFIDSRLLDARHELETKEESLRRFKENHIGTLPEQLPANLATLQRLQLEQQGVAAELRAAQTRLAAAEAASPSAPVRTQEDPELARLRAELVSLRTRYTEEHPDVQVLKSRIARLEAAQPLPGPTAPGPGATASSPVAQQARLEVKTLEVRQDDLQKRAAALDARVEQTPRTEQELTVLNRDYEKLKENYLSLLNRKMGARMAENLEKEWSGDRFRILDPANFPDRPFFPNPILFLIGGVIGGLALGLAAAFAAEVLDHSVKTAAEAESVLGLPILASIHHIDVPAGFASQAAVWATHARPEVQEPHVPVAVHAEVAVEREPAAAAPVSAPEQPAGQAALAAAEPPAAAPAPSREAIVAVPEQPVLAAAPAPSPNAEIAAAVEEPGVATAEIAAAETAPEAPAPESPAPVATEEVRPPAAPQWEEPAPPAVFAPEAFIPEGFAAEPSPPAAVDERPRVFRAPEPAVAAYQRTPAKVERETEPDLAARPPRLTADGGLVHGSFLELDGPGDRLLGSAPRCDLRLDLGNVDPVHARVTSSSRGVFISDAGSARGTFVNGRRIQDAHLLRANDEILLGPPGARQSAMLVFTSSALATDWAPPVAVETTAAAPAVKETTRVPMATPGPSAAPVVPAAAATTVPTGLEVRPPAASLPAKRAVPDVSTGDTTLPLRLPSAAPAPPWAFPDLPPPAQVPAPAPRTAMAAQAPLRLPLPAVTIRPPRKGTLQRAGIAVVVAVLLAGGVVAVRATLSTPPVVSGVRPFRAAPGQTVTVVGDGFRASAAVVRFGEQVAEVMSASSSRLVVTVPKTASGGEAPVTVEMGGHRTKPVPFKVASIPRVRRVEPPVALPGDEVTLLGENLRGDFSIYVGGQRAEVSSAEPERLRFRVPPSLALSEGARVPITFETTDDLSTPAALYLGHLPLLLEVRPAQGESGTRVTIRGLGFAPETASNVVTFGGREALVFTSQPEEIVVAAPSGGTVSGQMESEVSLSTRGVASASQLPFTLVRPATELFVPRFFPAPVPGHERADRALVSTELGPVLLLTGAAGGLSAAERAERAANLMNGLAESAAEPLVLEARTGAEAGVALAGGATSVVSATAGDAAGYAEQSGARPAPSPSTLAIFWTALLKDHLALFVAGHRPTHLVELSSRGQALLDLYAASLHRGAARGGVPASLVTPLSPSMAEAFRTMALTLPTEGQPAAGAAVAGRWVGSMEEDDAGTLPVEIRLAVEKNRLRGTLAMVAQPGGVRLETSLDSPSYSKGAVSFRMTLRGRPLIFKGTFRDETLSGTLASMARPDHPVGFITVHYAD